MFGVVAIIVVAAVVAAGRFTEVIRALLLAAAAGVLFGLLAAVTLSFTRLVRGSGLAAALGPVPATVPGGLASSGRPAAG